MCGGRVCRSQRADADPLKDVPNHNECKGLENKRKERMRQPRDRLWRPDIVSDHIRVRVQGTTRVHDSDDVRQQFPQGIREREWRPRVSVSLRESST